MIGCVCLNSAVDVTYGVDALVPGETHRVREMHSRAGGKGVNVARVLRQLGEEATVFGFVGGATGTEIVRDLDDSAIRHRLTHTDASARRTVTVVSSDATTVLNEPGGPITDGEWARFVDEFARVCADLDAVALSGSLPRGVPDTAYRELVEIARSAAVPVLLDAEGEALRAGLRARPDLITPNHAEAGALLDGVVETAAQARDAGRELRGRGADCVVITRGAAGLVAVRGDHAVTVTPGADVTGNPTGAGDALAAVLVRRLARAHGDWQDALRTAVAVSAGAVARPTAGEFDPEVARRVAQDIQVRRMKESR